MLRYSGICLVRDTRSGCWTTDWPRLPMPMAPLSCSLRPLIDSRTLGNTFTDVAVPVWVAKPWLLDDMDMTGTAGGTDYGTVLSATVTIVDDGHPLAAGLSGEVTVNSGGRTMSFGVPGGDAAIVSTAAEVSLYVRLRRRWDTRRWFGGGRVPCALVCLQYRSAGLDG